jgi:hypothetical protein
VGSGSSGSSDERVASAALARALGAEDREPIVIERSGQELTLSILRTATRRHGGASRADVRVATRVDHGAGEPVDERPEVRVIARASNARSATRGLDRVSSTGDAHFDARVQLESYASDAVLRAVFHASTRPSVLELLELQCTELGMFREPELDTLTADVWIRPGNADDLARLERIAASLVELPRALPVA